MEEMVLKNKVQAYFDYFKQDNPLFGDEMDTRGSGPITEETGL